MSPAKSLSSRGKVLSVALLSVLLLIAFAFANESPREGKLIVGSELDFPPFALVDKDGKADGFTVELWQTVAWAAGLDATIKTGPFHEILDEFKAGRIHILINLAQSEERRQFADFSLPHVKMGGASIAARTCRSSLPPVSSIPLSRSRGGAASPCS